MATQIKLTDALIRYSISGKSDRTEWQEFNSTLIKKGSAIRDSEVKGFQVFRSGKETISFRFDHWVNGKRKNLTLGQWPAITTVQARALAKEKSLAVANGNSPLDEKQAARVEVQNTLKSYLDHEYSLHMQRAITGNEYIALIRNAFPALLNKPLTEINKTDLVKWLQAQMKCHDANEFGYSSESIKGRYSALKSLMSHAVRNGVIQSNPFDRMEKLDFSKDESTGQQAKRTYLSIEQQQAFLLSVDAYDERLRIERRNSRAHGRGYLPDLDNLAFASHHKPMMIVLYYMGMRSGDVIGLEWTHVIDTPFTCSISKVLEKTRRKIKTPFNLPMPEPVRVALREWRKQQGNPANGLVFPSPVNGRRMSKSCLNSSWKWIKQDADFHENLQLYTLRHNFISWLIMNNTPIKVVAEMSGHKSIEMIDRYYSHLISGATTEASNSFAELLKKQA